MTGLNPDGLGRNRSFDSIETKQRTLTEPAVVASATNGNLSETFPASEFADGEATIQAAIDALPTTGGGVYILSTGPDTATDRTGTSRSNVWEINRGLTTDGKNGVHLIGDGPGWEGSGTSLICGDASVGSMLTMDGGFLDTVRFIGFDGADNASECVDFGGGTGNNDWQAWGCMFTNATNAAVLLTGDKNFWITNCWMEYSEAGIKTNGGIAPSRIWIRDPLFAQNTIDIHIRDPCDGLIIQRADSEKAASRAILVDNSPLTNARIVDCTWQDVSDSLGGAAVRFSNPGTVDDIQFVRNYYDGGGVAQRVANTNAPGDLGDVRFRDEVAEGLTVEKYGPNIRSTARIDGEVEQSANAETPTATGVPGQIKFTDTGDGSASGLYLEDKGGTIHGPV